MGTELIVKRAVQFYFTWQIIRSNESTFLKRCKGFGREAIYFGQLFFRHKASEQLPVAYNSSCKDRAYSSQLFKIRTVCKVDIQTKCISDRRMM